MNGSRAPWVSLSPQLHQLHCENASSVGRWGLQLEVLNGGTPQIDILEDGD